MARVFEGTVEIDYSQAYVMDVNSGIPDMSESFRGQSNGLCGAATGKALFLHTGLHIGPVGFTIDLLEAPPLLEDDWEEIIEASFYVSATAPDVALLEWAGESSYPIPLLPGSYRVRYCARGMDLGAARPAPIDDLDPIDFYALAFWPAE